jgi:pyruvate-formate lyase-activating enzyme
MEKGNWPDGCKRCNTKERTRFDYYETLYGHLRSLDKESTPLKTMDLRFGNLCNASCITCDFTNSSYFEKVKNQGYFLTDDHYSPDKKRIDHITSTMDWHEDVNTIDDIINNLEHIDLLYVTGGEPTINPMFHKILEYLIDNNRAKDIRIELNTNGTNFNGRFAELIQPFNTTMMFSIDAIGELNNAMRYPTKFTAVSKNISEYYSKMKPGDELVVAPTLCVFNFFKLVEIIDWCKENNYPIAERLNILSRPYWQNLSMLPDDLYTEGLLKIQKSYPQFYKQIKQRISSGAAYIKDPDPTMNWDKVLWRAQQWFTSRGYDPKLTGIPGI